jgi:hypothetical protein
VEAGNVDRQRRKSDPRSALVDGGYVHVPPEDSPAVAVDGVLLGQ